MKGLLRMKPAGVFALVFVPGFVMGMLGNLGGIQLDFAGEYTYPIIQLVSMLPLYLWYISIATGLKQELPANVKSKIKPIGFIFGLLLHIAVMYWMGGLLDELYELTDKMNGRTYVSNRMLEDLLAIYGRLFLILIVMIVAMIPIANHLAVIIKSGQTGKKESYSTAKLEFWMSIIYVVGVWIIQPRINKIMNGEYKSQWEDVPKELSDSDEILD